MPFFQPRQENKKVSFCATHEPANDCSDYEQAIIDTSLHALPLSKNLLLVPRNAVSRMVSYVNKTENFYHLQDTFLSVTTWTSLEPQLRSLCQAFTQEKQPSSLELRLWLLQLLGLPHYEPEDYAFVIFDVPFLQAYENSLTGIFRPCNDPRIYWHEGPICPAQVQNDLSFDSNFYTWFINQAIQSYTLERKNGRLIGFPWTGLGFTYNWYSQSEGVSEFVVLPKTPIKMIAVDVSADDYCRINKD